MASSSKQNWQLGDAGILRKKEDEEELLVFGYSCKLFRDDEKALFIDQGKHLIPWMGDDTLKIDRYDGRGTLYDLKQYEPLPGGYDESLWVGLSDSERHVEQLCNEERYHALHHNEDEEALYQEKCNTQPSEGRGVRRRRQFHSDPSCCPVCGITVRTAELHTHLEHEVEKLGKLSKQRRLSSESPGPSVEFVNTNPNRTTWDTYLKIKANRKSRLRVKKPKPNEAKCPVCNILVRGSIEELSRHVENCLRVQEEAVDIEIDDGVFREYEWAGQERIRATTLLDGGYAATGMSTSSRSNHVDDDADLVVDEDDLEMYGPPQYSEADVIVTSAEGPEEEAERMALREAVIRPGGNTETSVNNARVNICPVIDGRKGESVGDPSMSSDISGNGHQKLSNLNACINEKHNKIFIDSDSSGHVRSKCTTALATNSSHNTNNIISNSVYQKVQTCMNSALDTLHNEESPKLIAEGINSGSRHITTNTMESTSSSKLVDVVAKGHPQTSNQVLKALKSHIEELEKVSPLKCLICLGKYTQPVISVTCWHVHCEDCWLHSLGTKKLCPQCNTITSPSDLRKIYM